MQTTTRPRRSLLFVPCDRREMLDKAAQRGADALILNLEDAVSPEHKTAARANVKSALLNHLFDRVETILRINPIDTAIGFSDLLELAPLSPNAILLPKVGSAEEVRFVAFTLDRLEEIHGLQPNSIALMGMIESASGIEHAFSSATCHPRQSALVFGAADLALDMDCLPGPEQSELTYARQRLVIAARAAGIDAIDSPHMQVDDIPGLRASAQRARSLGFDGKSAIHPAQISTLNAAFTPSNEEIAWARRVIEAFSGPKSESRGALLLDGSLIEAPHILQARRILHRASQDA